MRFLKFLILLLGVSFNPTGAIAALPVAVEGEPLPSLAPMLERVTPAVVNISTRGRVTVRENPLLSDPFFRRFFDYPERSRERQTQSLGSGVILDAKQGLIVTNHHVIEAAQEITVILRDGRRLNATLVGADPDTDVAVIKVPADNLTLIPLADSDALRVGDFVVAIGNPFGLGQTVTSGIVSALGRSGLGIEGFENFIQTDASINPGNSGGALVNLRGELVGINTAIIAPGGGNIGIGFAIPANMARSIVDQLVAFGEVRRGLLGVVVQDLTPDLANAFGISVREGAVIAQVSEGSPAAVAGLQAGDVVTAVNGRPIRNADGMRNAIGVLRVGETVRIGVQRNGKGMTLEARLAEPRSTAEDGGAIHPRLAGASIGDIDANSPLHGRIEGVSILTVEYGSPVWRAGLREGDVITAANRVRVRSLDEFKQVIARGNRRLMLTMQRGNASLFVLLQ